MKRENKGKEGRGVEEDGDEMKVEDERFLKGRVEGGILDKESNL